MKKRLNYMQSLEAEADAIFSPDGEWLLASEKEQGSHYGQLRRFEVQTGKATSSLNQFTSSRSFGFSPDGRFLWFVEEDGYGIKFKFHVATNPNSILGATDKWSQSCSGPPKWLPDGRIGLVKPDGFEWRDASGRLLGRLPGPFQSLRVTPSYVQSWALSPDGNYIYSAEQSGTIRRWRAR